MYLSKNQKIGLALRAPVQDRIFATTFESNKLSPRATESEPVEGNSPDSNLDGDPTVASESQCHLSVEHIRLENLSQYQHVSALAMIKTYTQM